MASDLNTIKRNVRDLLEEFGWKIPLDEFGLVYGLQYNAELDPTAFGCLSIQQMIEMRLGDVVRIAGATHRDRVVVLKKLGAPAPSAAAKPSPRTGQRTETPRTTPSSRGLPAPSAVTGTAERRRAQPRPAAARQNGQEQSSSRTQPFSDHRQVSGQASTATQQRSATASGQASRQTSAVSQQRSAAAGSQASRQASAVTQQRSVAAGNQAGSQASRQASAVTQQRSAEVNRAYQPRAHQPYHHWSGGGGGSRRGCHADPDLIKELDSRAKYHAKQCRVKHWYVDPYYIGQTVLKEFRVRNFRDLGLRGDYDVPFLGNLKSRLAKVNEEISAFCMVRSTSTLYDLEKYLALSMEMKNFTDLGLGPLLKHPAVWQYFKPARTVRAIPEITAMDMIEYLKLYMDRKEMWRTRIHLRDFLQFVVEERGCYNAYELCVRVRSIGLPISVLKKNQRSEKEAWRRIREETAERVEKEVDGKLQEAYDKLLGQGGRLEELAGKSPDELIRHVFSFLANREAFPFFFKRATKQFFSFLGENELAGKLFKLAFCNGQITEASVAVEEAPIPTVQSPSVGQIAVEKEKDVQNEDESDEDEYDEDWARRHKHNYYREGEVIEEVLKWLSRQIDDLDLRALARVEKDVARFFETENFSDLDQGSFLHFITHQQRVEMLLKGAGSLGFGSSGVSDRGSGTGSGPGQLYVSKEYVLDFLKQCGLEKDERFVLAALCHQFGIQEVEDLCLGSLKRLTDQARDHTSTVPVSDVFGFPLPVLLYESALLCGAEDRVIEMQGWQRTKAISCLLSCPPLENLAEWSQWSEVFAGHHGPLKNFLLHGVNKERGLYVLETEPGVFIRVDPQSSDDALFEAVASGNATMAASQIVAMLVKSDNVGHAPLALYANSVRTALEKLSATTSVIDGDECESGLSPFLLPESERERDALQQNPTVDFVLKCLLKIPFRLCAAVAQQLLLEPLNHIVGSALASKLLLQQCSSDSERTVLQRLGIRLGVPEWTEEFELRAKQLEETKKVEEEIIPPEMTEILLPSVPNLSMKSDEEEPPESESEADNAIEFEESVEEDFVDDGLPFPGGFEGVFDSDQEEPEVEEESAEFTPELDDDEKCDAAKSVIESILKDEFGVGLHLDAEQDRLFQTGRRREGRGLHRLSSELYSRDTHFVLELVQNADDNSYPEEYSAQPESSEVPSIVFIVSKQCVTVLNNESGFKEKDIRALCDVGRSTKGKHKKGYIGQKGIGFKSVFRVSDTPEVHSNGFYIRFDALSGPIGYIFPHWIEGEGRRTFKTETEDVDVYKGKRWTTKIILPLKRELQGQVKSLAPRFHDLQPSLLLFLHRLRRITVVDKVNHTERSMERRDLSEGLVEISHTFGKEKFLVVRKQLDASNQGKEGVESTELAIGFPLPVAESLKALVKGEESISQQKVFAFLPLQSYGFRFVVQGDFDVPSSREAVDESSAWNQWLRHELPGLFVHEGLEAFKTLLGMSPVDTFCIFLRFVPQDTEVRDFFHPVAKLISQKLKATPCMPVLPSDHSCDLEWVLPSRSVIARDPMVLDLIPSDKLKQYLGLYYLHPKVAAVIGPTLAKNLGVEEFSTSLLTKVLSMLCSVDSSGEESINMAERLPVPWLARWMVCFFNAMIQEHKTVKDFQDTLFKLPIVPLSSGSYVAFSSCTTKVFFPIEDKEKKGKVPQYLQILQSDVNIVSEELLTCQRKSDNHTVHQLLEDLGVKQFTRSREVIMNHILPIFQSDQWQTKRRDAIVSYILFIFHEKKKDKAVCSLEDLSDCIVFATNNGLVKASENIIHFPKGPFLESDLFNLEKHFPEMQFLVLDELYEKLARSADISSLRKFLIILGVNESLAIKERKEAITEEELKSSRWAEASKNWKVASEVKLEILDYYCPEFLDVLNRVANLDREKQEARLKSMVELFNASWDKCFQSKVTGKATASGDWDDSEESFMSTFILDLRNHMWIPATEKRNRLVKQTEESKQSPTLYKPSKVFVFGEKTRALFGEHVRYLRADVTEGTDGKSKNGFIKEVDFKSWESVTPDVVMDFLVKWTRGAVARNPTTQRELRLCSMSQYQMCNVYKYLLSRVIEKKSAYGEKVKAFFHEEAVFFVPDRSDYSENEQEKGVLGSFFSFREVCWIDPSRALEKRRERGLIVPGRQLLDRFYSSFSSAKYLGLESLLLQKVDLQEYPTNEDYVSLIQHIVSNEIEKKMTSREIFEDLLELYNVIVKSILNTVAEAVYESQKGKPLRHIAEKSRQDLLAAFERETKSKITEKEIREHRNLHSMQEVTRNKRIFFTSKNKWVSAQDYLIIDDERSEVSRLLAEQTNVHFARLLPMSHGAVHTDIPGILRQEANEVREEHQLAVKRLQKRTGEKQEETQRFFWAACGIPHLSTYLRKEMRVTASQPCLELHRYVSNVIPYLQRFVFYRWQFGKAQPGGKQSADTTTADRLKRLECFAAAKLTQALWIEGVPNSELEQPLGATIRDNQLLVAKEHLERSQFHRDVNEELIKLVDGDQPPSKRTDKLRGFLVALVKRLDNPEQCAREERLQQLPRGEAKWQIAPFEETPAMVETNAEETKKGEEEEYDYDFKEVPKAVPAGAEDESNVLKRWPPGSSASMPDERDAGEQGTMSDILAVIRSSDERADENPLPQQISDKRLDQTSHEQENRPRAEAPPQGVLQPSYPLTQYPMPPFYMPNNLRSPFTQPPMLNTPEVPLLAPPMPMPGATFRPIPTLPGLMPAPSFIPRPVAEIKFEEVTVPMGTSPRSVTLSDASTVDIGRYGEELVLLCLSYQKQQGSLLYRGLPVESAEIFWSNQQVETGNPFDIQIVYRLAGGEQRQSFVEVKTTVTEDKMFFPISSAELAFAHVHKEDFSIYRVFNAGKETVKVAKLENVTQYLGTNQIKLFLLL